MKLIKKHWKKILIALAVIFFIYKIATTFFVEKEAIKNTETMLVETFSLTEKKEGNLDTFCSVETSTDAPVTAEASGKVTSVLVKDSAQIKKGDVLFTLENVNQRLGVQNALVALKSAQLALSELLNNNSDADSSLLSQTKKQQDISIASARNIYLNTDLRAYPEDYDESSEAPKILGNYSCNTEGQYIIETYSSASSTGASFYVKGLESGRNTVSVDYAVPFGNCGLEIVFPKDFKSNKTWVIPVPNTRSGQYFSNKKNYENLVSGKDIVVINTKASPERISQERARVTQAQLQLESAQHELEKSSIRATVSGTLTDFDIAIGDFVSMNQDYGRIKSIDTLQLVAYINADEKKYIAEGSAVNVNDKKYQIELVSASVDSMKKIKVTITPENDSSFIEGTEYACSLERTNNNTGDDIVVPLSSISIIGNKPYVLMVEDGIAYKKEIETGAILGKDIIIYGVVSGDVIRDARSVRDNQRVTTK